MTSDNDPLYEPYNLTFRHPVFTILRFAPALAMTPKPAKRARARIYCHHCHRYHHLAWGEMQNAITLYKAQSYRDIVTAYAWKYCQFPDATRESLP